MKRMWNAGLVVSVAVLCVGSTLLAEDAMDAKAAKAAAKAENKVNHAAKAAAPAPGVRLPADFQDMVKALNLGEDVQLKLGEIAKSRAAALKEFEDAHKAEQTELKAAVAAAKTAGNRDAIKENMTKLNDLDTQEKAKVAPFEEAAMALLTPDQQSDWRIYKVTKEVLNGLHGVKLTDDQSAQVKTLVMAQLPALTAAGDNPAQRRPIFTALRESIQKNVLTADQLAAIQSHGDRSKMGTTAATQPSAK